MASCTEMRSRFVCPIRCGLLVLVLVLMLMCLKDKEKPMAVRAGNIMAARCMLELYTL